MVKSWFKSDVTLANLNQYQIPHLLNPFTWNYIKVQVIYRFWQSDVKVTSLCQFFDKLGFFSGFSLHIQQFFCFGYCRWCSWWQVKDHLLISCPTKKIQLRDEAKLTWSQSRGSGNRPNGASWVVVYIPCVKPAIRPALPPCVRRTPRSFAPSAAEGPNLSFAAAFVSSVH